MRFKKLKKLEGGKKMKKLALVWILVLILGLGVAGAQVVIPNPPDPPKDGFAASELTKEEIQTEIDGVFNLKPEDSTLKCVPVWGWADKNDPYHYYCNWDPTITVNVSASVAQWVDVCLSATTIQWWVLKPGTYWVDCMDGVLFSNGDVAITFAGFEDLENSEGDIIETWYAKQELFPHHDWFPVWVSAENLDGTYTIEENETCHCYMWKLFNSIGVKLCDSAGEYSDPDGATITVNLMEQQEWVCSPSQTV